MVRKVKTLEAIKSIAYNVMDGWEKDNAIFTHGMIVYCGKSVEIIDFNGGLSQYEFMEKSGKCLFSEWMLEGKAESFNNLYGKLLG